MRESDRTSIHEAMEQQTISMAKAGIVCKLNTRCAVLAAANPKNLHAMSEPESTSSVNIGIATPLLSRFDLVFILRDERIPEWDDAIADHLLAQVTAGYEELTIQRNAEIWSAQKLQAHFVAISQLQPKMSPIASAILGTYYRKCRSDPERDQGRTTIRLLDSLNRLAVAHARLVFREEVTAVDAIITVRLMESTFGFGRIVKPYDVIKEELPLGPDAEEVRCILSIFDMEDGSDVTENSNMDHSFEQFKTPQSTAEVKEKNANENGSAHNHEIQNTSQTTRTSNTSSSTEQRTLVHTQARIQSQKQEPAALDQTQVKNSELQGKSQSQSGAQTKECRMPNAQPIIDMDLDKIDELLSFDVDGKYFNEHGHSSF